MKEKKFHAPKKDEEFIYYWDKLLPQVVKRENFHESHLEQLEILCDLYLDYNRLTEFVKINGFSFMTSGRYGDTSREHVEVKVRQKTVSEIRAYSKLLGLTLSKDDAATDEVEDEWK
jgi:phage terminase small subunit